jgi:hypothetical protein
LTIKIGNGKILTHPPAPSLKKRRGEKTCMNLRLSPFSSQEKGVGGDEFKSVKITELDRQNS